jgi:hypothetical protein
VTGREAACHCGQLRVAVEGDPLDVWMCHCHACQRRSGSAFALQAAFPAERARVEGRASDHVRVTDEADGKEHVFHFCPECGSGVYQTEPSEPDLVIVAVGAFADSTFPPPTASGYDFRRHGWLRLPDSVPRSPRDAWRAEAAPLYDAGRFAEAAERGRALLEELPGEPLLHYNVACCESRAGRAGPAVEHLRAAIEGWDGCRGMAREDADLDAVRDDPAFRELVGG